MTASWLSPGKLSPCTAIATAGGRPMWNLIREELREVVWLASVIGALSVAGVAAAVFASAVI